MNKPRMRDHLLKVREDAIIHVVNQLLSDKGYDLMTVDEVAANAGLSKASLYTHFRSKEALAAAAMIRVTERALAFAQSDGVLAVTLPVDRLKAVVRWSLEVQLAGSMPALPAQNSALRAYMSASKPFTKLLMQLSDILGAWIEQAQRDGALDDTVPAEVVLFTIYARACDQVLQVLKASKQHTDAQIITWVLHTSFQGLTGSAKAKPAAARRVAVTAKPRAPLAKASKPNRKATAHR